MNCLCHYKKKVYGSVANATFFDIPPVFDFFPEEEFCLNEKSRLTGVSEINPAPSLEASIGGRLG